MENIDEIVFPFDSTLAAPQAAHAPSHRRLQRSHSRPFTSAAGEIPNAAHSLQNPYGYRLFIPADVKEINCWTNSSTPGGSSGPNVMQFNRLSI